MTENEFISAVKRNNRRLYLLALSFTQNSSDAEDIMQNTFVKLWKHNKQFEDDNHIDKWLTAVCVNESKDFIKKPFRKRSISIDEMINLSHTDDTANIDLFKAVMLLPLKERTVIHFFYYFVISGDELRRSKESRFYEGGTKHTVNYGYFLNWDISGTLVTAIEQDPYFDLSQITDTITFTVEFNDGTVKTASINLYFDSDGYMHFKETE